jgi:hypothetical protein
MKKTTKIEKVGGQTAARSVIIRPYVIERDSPINFACLGR